MIISIIPARGGSKGIPKKNITLLAGKPLIAHSIETSLNCPLVNRTLVSTDIEEIAAVALEYGAEVPFLRPSELAQDDTQDFPVIHHTLEWLRDNEGHEPDIVVQLRPTTPLRPPGLIEQAIRMLQKDPSADSVRSVEVSPYTPYKMWQKEGLYIKPFLKLDGVESYNMGRQFLPEVLYHNGVLDVFWASPVLEKKTLTGSKILPLNIDDSFYIVDIDKPVDLVVAEAFFKINLNRLKQSGSGSTNP